MKHAGNIRDYTGSYPIQAVADFYGISYDTAFNLAGGVLDRHYGRKRSVWYDEALWRLAMEVERGVSPNQVYCDLSFFVRKHILAGAVRPAMVPPAEA